MEAALRGQVFERQTVQRHVLAQAGIHDLDSYAVAPGERLMEDFFVGDPPGLAGS